MPLLPIENGWNFRDLGGIKTQDGRQLKAHKLIRSGHLGKLSKQDQQFLADYGLTTVMDFRSPEEQKKDPDLQIAGTTYNFNPVFEVDETKSALRFNERKQLFSKEPLIAFREMVDTYQDLVSLTHSQRAYQQFFDALLANEQDDQALLFHCSAGKDRTGMGAVYTLSALGVAPMTVRQDYLASNHYLFATNQQLVQDVIYRGGNRNVQANTWSLMSVANEYLDAALLTIEANYGSLDQYLTESLDLTPEKRKALQQIYLED